MRIKRNSTSIKGRLQGSWAAKVVECIVAKNLVSHKPLKSILSVVVILLFCTPTQSQYYYYNKEYYDNDFLLEGGISIGLMKGVTDVGAKKGGSFSPATYDWKTIQPFAGIYVGMTYKYLYEARLELNFGHIEGNDANSNSNFVKSRNLHYKTSIVEGSLLAAVYPLMFLNTDNIPAFSPYVMAGVGIFSFYPTGYYKGNWYRLRRLHTEGQTSVEFPERKEYNLKSICFPMGLGLRYEINHKINLRVEGIYRNTLSDYLDDVSKTYVDPDVVKRRAPKAEREEAVAFAQMYKQVFPNANFVGRNRGNANTTDKYFTINFKVGYVLGRTRIKQKDVP